MDSFSFAPGLTLVNAFNRETFVFTTPESAEAAEFEVRLESGGLGRWKCDGPYPSARG